MVENETRESGLTETQVGKFHEDGFLKIGRVLSEEDLEVLRRAFAIHYMPPGTRSESSGKYLEVSFGRPMLRMRM